MKNKIIGQFAAAVAALLIVYGVGVNTFRSYEQVMAAQAEIPPAIVVKNNAAAGESESVTTAVTSDTASTAATTSEAATSPTESTTTATESVTVAAAAPVETPALVEATPAATELSTMSIFSPLRTHPNGLTMRRIFRSPHFWMPAATRRA